MAGRQLKIKVGVLSRTKKEFAMYVKEHQAEQAKTDKMKAEGADAAQIKQQVGGATTDLILRAEGALAP